MTTGQENRRSFRINESAYVSYEILGDKEFDNGLERLRISSGLGRDKGAQASLVDIEARLSEASYLLGPEFDQVSRCITLLNDKLNIVIEQLPGLRAAKAALTSSAPLSCDISADGMVFPAEKELAQGTKLHLQFLLASDNRYVETFARVVRTADVPPGNNGGKFKCGVAVEYVGMKSTQREILIQHMFNKESETLRMRRLQIDADG